MNMWKGFVREFRTLALWQKALFLVVIVGFAFFFGAHRHGKATNLPPATNCSGISQSVTLTLTDKSINPKNSKIHVCDTLVVTNQSSTYRQPALGSHPDHLEYPGYEAETAIAPGGTFSIQIVHTGKFLIHDHLEPSVKGYVTASK